MERRLGRIQARHSQVTDLFTVALRETPEGVRRFSPRFRVNQFLVEPYEQDLLIKMFDQCAERRIGMDHSSPVGRALFSQAPAGPKPPSRSTRPADAASRAWS
jgi:hypothetical protein